MMAPYSFKQGWYYMAGVDKPAIAPVGIVIDEVESRGFEVLTYGECETFGVNGQMPFPTQGQCPDDYDWVGLVRRTGPDEIIDMPSQVLWIQGWPPDAAAAADPTVMPMPFQDVFTWHFYMVTPQMEEPELLGIFQLPKMYADMIVERIAYFNTTTETGRTYVLVPAVELGFWARLKLIWKTFSGSNTWYDVYWAPVQTPQEPASLILAKVFMGRLWISDSGLNDFYCDLGEMLPRLVLRDYKRNTWITMIEQLPKIYDTAGGVTGLLVGRICR